jgi:hypothetical protein
MQAMHYKTVQKNQMNAGSALQGSQPDQCCTAAATNTTPQHLLTLLPSTLPRPMLLFRCR